jgi:hypothetical protein
MQDFSIFFAAHVEEYWGRSSWEGNSDFPVQYYRGIYNPMFEFVKEKKIQGAVQCTPLSGDSFDSTKYFGVKLTF